MIIITNYETIKNDLFDVMHLYYPDKELNEDKPILTHKMSRDKNVVENTYTIDEDEGTFEFAEKRTIDQRSGDALDEKRQLKRFAKLSLYKMLSNHFNKNMPWGALTGVRPTKIGYDLINQGVKPFMLQQALMENFLLSSDKAHLVEMVIQNQKCIIRNDKLVDLYINIPICPTRCTYCSFISSQYDAVKDIIDKYLETLIKEINATKKLIQDNAYILRTIYIGGGTPTVLTAEQLDYLLDNLNYPVNEFTVECGRPDTITKEKLDVLKKHNVTRISINPQTFSDETLKRIGRKHTVKDTIMAYKLSLGYDFVVNMDIIAGLPKESFATFKKSIDTLMLLAPDNITVHTLALKKGSLLQENRPKPTNKIVDKMIDYAEKTLHDNGYKPYYLYRQKNQLEGQENVGYYKDHVCLFNVDTMEECLSVLACGAGAISKRVYNLDNRIEREANVKDIKQYIERIDEMIDKKQKLFS